MFYEAFLLVAISFEQCIVVWPEMQGLHFRCFDCSAIWPAVVHYALHCTLFYKKILCKKLVLRQLNGQETFSTQATDKKLALRQLNGQETFSTQTTEFKNL